MSAAVPPCLKLTLGATVPGITLGAASVAGVGGMAAYERLAIHDALGEETLCAGRAVRAASDAAGSARRRDDVAGTPRERVAVRMIRVASVGQTTRRDDSNGV